MEVTRELQEVERVSPLIWRVYYILKGHHVLIDGPRAILVNAEDELGAMMEFRKAFTVPALF